MVAVGGARDDRMVEHAGHLHEHFVTALDVRGGAYRPSTVSGFGAEFRRESVAQYQFPNGEYWARNGRTHRGLGP